VLMQCEKTATGTHQVVGDGMIRRICALSGETCQKVESLAGVRGSIVVVKRCNSGGAKGLRKVDV
jgi:hypothetical protein